MSALVAHPLTEWTVVDLMNRFGPISINRICLDPPPGSATEQDVLDLHDREGRLYELVDGVLVEKVMGFPESSLALELGRLVGNFVDRHDLGILTGEAGMIRLTSGLVRIPDLAFFSWERLPNRRVPRQPIPKLAPNLAVEVLSQGNTKEEMKDKLREYFKAGVRLVWYVDPGKRTVRVYTAPARSTLLHENQTLDGGEVLPGFKLPLKELFAHLDRRPRKRPLDR